MNDDELLAQGYTDLRRIEGRLCGLLKMLFTTGLMVGLDADGYEYRYCYESAAGAREALREWDGTGHPPGLWIKRKGLGIGEEINPNWSQSP